MTGQAISVGFGRADRTERRFAVRTRTVVVATCLLAVVATIAARPIIGTVESWLDLGVLAAVALVSDLPRRRPTRRRVNLSLVGVILLAAIPLGAGIGIGLISVVACCAHIRRRPWRNIAFNIGMSVTVGMAGAVGYTLAGGPARSEFDQGLEAIVLVGAALLVADIAQLLVNAGLMSAIIWASRGFPVRAQFLALARSEGITYLASGVLALLIFVAWVPAGGGPLSILLLIPSLVATRWALTTEREVDRAQFRVVEALSAAMEARQEGAAQRSRDVAQVSEWLADEIGLGPAASTQSALAGALVGLPELALPPDANDGDQPHQPYRALAKVEFLESVLPALEHDPGSGRVGQIVTVADSYVRERQWRGDDQHARAASYAAVAAAGDRGYDPSVVAALGRVVARLDPTPHPRVAIQAPDESS